MMFLISNQGVMYKRVKLAIDLMEVF